MWPIKVWGVGKGKYIDLLQMCEMWTRKTFILISVTSCGLWRIWWRWAGNGNSSVHNMNIGHVLLLLPLSSYRQANQSRVLLMSPGFVAKSWIFQTTYSTQLIILVSDWKVLRACKPLFFYRDLTHSVFFARVWQILLKDWIQILNITNFSEITKHQIHKN